MVLDANDAVTPAGKPDGVPIPVAPVVVNVILVSAVLIHTVGLLDAALTVLVPATVTVVETLADAVQVPIASAQ